MPSLSADTVGSVNNLRTLALVGPAAAGKTSLAEALLWRAGAIGAPAARRRMADQVPGCLAAVSIAMTPKS